MLIGSDLRTEPAYTRTAIPQLTQEAKSSTDATLVSSFGVGAYALPIDTIAALARDQLALRLHRAVFPAKVTAPDREAARYKREILTDPTSSAAAATMTVPATWASMPGRCAAPRRTCGWTESGWHA